MTPSDTGKRVTSVINALGLVNCASATIGDESTHRASSGQRRREIVGEMLLSANSSFFVCLGNTADRLASTDRIELASNIIDAH